MFYSRHKKLLSPETQRGKIMTLLLLVAFLPQLCIDLYLPSMPAMQGFFNTSNRYIQYTLAIYLIAAGTAQLLYGPFADKYGRRPIIILGLSIFFIGSLGCMMTNNIYLFLLSRFIQGAGGAAVTIAYRATIRDLYDGNKLSKIISYANMGWVTVPIVAPVLGGYIQHYGDWRMNFTVIFVLSAFALIAIWNLFPETRGEIDPNSINEHTILKKYLAVFKNLHFLILITCAMLINAVNLGYNMISPFLLQVTLLLTPIKFGWTALIIAAGYLLGSTINSQCVMHVGMKRMIFIAMGILFLGALAFLALPLLGYFNVFTVIIPATIIFLGMGIAYPNFSSGALQCFKNLAGTAGSVLGLVQTGIGSLLAAVVTGLPHSTPIPFAIYCMIIIIFTLILAGVATRHAHS